MKIVSKKIRRSSCDFLFNISFSVSNSNFHAFHPFFCDCRKSHQNWWDTQIILFLQFWKIGQSMYTQMISSSKQHYTTVFYLELGISFHCKTANFLNNLEQWWNVEFSEGKSVFPADTKTHWAFKYIMPYFIFKMESMPFDKLCCIIVLQVCL